LPAHSFDLAILAVYLVATVLFGLAVGRRQRGVDDYMVGNRDIPWWALLFSIVATETSTVTFLSIPGFSFAHDMTWLQIAFGFVAGRFAVRWLLLPGYFAGSFFTAYEVLGRRFGGLVKPMASLVFIVTRSLADGLRLFLTALVVQEMAAVSLPSAIVLVGATTILYTVVGGMKAVVWTDVAQFVIYVAGAAVALALLLGRIPGGWPHLMTLANAHGKLRVLDLEASLTNPYVLWAGLFGGMFLTLGSHGSDQLMVQRYFCARSEAEAGRALWVSGFVILVQFAFFLFIGVALWGYYTLVPPAVPFDRPDRVFVHFIVSEMPPGVLGLVVGAIFAAAMSTLSSSLNASATAAVSDFYRPLRPETPPGDLLRITRAFTAFFGAVQMGVAFLGPRLAESIVSEVLTIAGFTTGVVLGVFFLGLFTRVGAGSAVAAMILGLALMTSVHLGTPLAWPWYAMVGSLGTFTIGLAAERLRPSSAQ
jgi:SSS family solute:Na+ symporter